MRNNLNISNEVIKKYRNNGEKGITLIALIITIIVILLLAGVAINTIVGGEGTPQKAVEARSKNESGTGKDAVYMLATQYIQEYMEKVHEQGDIETKENFENVGKYLVEKLNNNNESVDYYFETEEGKPNKIMLYNATRTQKLAEGTIQDDGIIIWDDTLTEDKDDVNLYVTNNNDEILIRVVGKENIKNVEFKNEAEEIVMNRTNPEESKIFEFTTKMTYAGKYTVKAYDVDEKESKEKEFIVSTDRELTYLYNHGTISSLAGDFKVAKLQSSYSAGTLKKQSDNLYFSRNCGDAQWAYSGFYRIH